MGKVNTNSKKATTNADVESLLQEYPLARAVRANDTSALTALLQDTILSPGASVQNVKLEQSIGEMFTGGRSTPIYYLQCKVLRNSISSNSKATSRQRQRQLVIKLVLMPPDDNTDNPNDRSKTNSKIEHKRESYAVEYRFYNSSAASRMRQTGGLHFPKLLYSDTDGRRAYPVACFCMNDLRMQFPLHPSFLPPWQAHAALKWLATMHATMWGETDGIWRRDVWPRGGFWTYKKETSPSSSLASQWMATVRWLDNDKKHRQRITAATRGLGVRLERLATPLSEFLENEAQQASWSTLIHGDYKAANLFFREPIQEQDCNPNKIDTSASIVAAVDFQYTGAGLGAEDVAYLLYPDAYGHFWEHEDALLGTYHETLVEQLILQRKGGPSSLSREGLQRQYELARLDLTRHWLSKGWVASTEGEAILVTALESTVGALDGGSALKTPEEYQRALEVFCALD